MLFHFDAYPKHLRLVTDTRQKPVHACRKVREGSHGENNAYVIYYMATEAPSDTLSDRLISS